MGVREGRVARGNSYRFGVLREDLIDLLISLEGFGLTGGEVEVVGPRDVVDDAVEGIGGFEVAEGLHLVVDVHAQVLGYLVHEAFSGGDLAALIAVVVHARCERAVIFNFEGFFDPIKEGFFLVEEATLDSVIGRGRGLGLRRAQEAGVNRPVLAEGDCAGRVGGRQVVLDILGVSEASLLIWDEELGAVALEPYQGPFPFGTGTLWVTGGPRAV